MEVNQRPPVYNNIYNAANNLGSFVAHEDDQLSESSSYSKKMSIEYEKSENKAFVSNKRSKSFDEAKYHMGMSRNSSLGKRKLSTIDEESEIAYFTSNSATRSSILSSSLSSNEVGLADSPLTVKAKYEQASIGQANSAESLLKGLVYHENMARQYLNTDNRTPEQDQKRRKNIQAARLSRARANLIEEQRKEIAARTNIENTRNKKTIGALIVYTNALSELLRHEYVDWIEKWKCVSHALNDKK